MLNMFFFLLLQLFWSGLGKMCGYFSFQWAYVKLFILFLISIHVSKLNNMVLCFFLFLTYFDTDGLDYRFYNVQ